MTVIIDDKFHIDASPASFDFLIPTSLEFKDIKPAKVEYPTSTLDVYEGSVVITARFPRDSLTGIKAIQGTLTVQACTDQICLPPSTLPVSIGAGGR